MLYTQNTKLSNNLYIFMRVTEVVAKFLNKLGIQTSVDTNFDSSGSYNTRDLKVHTDKLAKKLNQWPKKYFAGVEVPKIELIQ